MGTIRLSSIPLIRLTGARNRALWHLDRVPCTSRSPKSARQGPQIEQIRSTGPSNPLDRAHKSTKSARQGPQIRSTGPTNRPLGPFQRVPCTPRSPKSTRQGPRIDHLGPSIGSPERPGPSNPLDRVHKSTTCALREGPLHVQVPKIRSTGPTNRPLGPFNRVSCTPRSPKSARQGP